MNTDNPIPHNLSSITPATVGGSVFVVPLYQRLFAWSDKEVKVLLKDLQYHFRTNNSDPYYLGVVTTIKENNRYYLVDGQQRFTIMMIMASVFGQFPNQEGWRTFFADGKRLYLYARNEDAAFLKNLAGDKLTGKYKNSLMQSAYIAIKDFVKYLDEENREDFMINCFHRIKLFNSTLPPEYVSHPSSLNKYFEVMNSAGVNLEPHEVLKVLLLKNQPRHRDLLQIWNLCADFSRPLLKRKEEVSDKDYSNHYLELINLPISIAVEYILEYNSQRTEENNVPEFKTIAEIETEAQSFDNPFSDKRERSVLNFPEFLLMTLDLFYKNICGGQSFYKSDKLIERFNEYLRGEDVEGFYEKMLKLRIILDCFVIRRRIDGQESDYKLVFKEGSSFSHDCLEQYQAMLSVSTPYYKWLKSFVNAIDHGEIELSSRALLDFLKTSDNKEHKLPDVFSMDYENIDRYWFWRLDYLIWEDMRRPLKEENDKTPEYLATALKYRESILDYSFRTNRSIEHLHPQDESNNDDKWPRADIDSFGNLAMISQSFNSQQSNEDVNVKFSRVETQARSHKLQSLKLLLMYTSVKGDADGWTIEEAHMHQTAMYERLNKSFLSIENE